MGRARALSDGVSVVGGGPNGLAAAIALTQRGYPVTLFEGRDRIGGSVASAALTLPGFVHDICSSVYPLAVASPFFRSLPLAAHGLEWCHPPIALAHPFDDGTAVGLLRSLDETAAQFGDDARTYRRLLGPLVDAWHRLVADVLAPIGVPAHPLVMARFAAAAAWPAAMLARAAFSSGRARAYLAGLAAHSARALTRPLTSAFFLLLAAAGHASGWPFARGGAGRLADALGGCLVDSGGRIETGTDIVELSQLPASRAVMCDVTPAQLRRLAGEVLPDRYHRALARYRYGPGAFKVDWALDGPIPWRAALCHLAGTVHVGGSFEEIARGEHEVEQGRHPQRPFLLLAQPSVCDATRAPAGQHTAWAYCHVPNGSRVDMLDRIERQVERFAPGFRDRILARHVMDPAALEAHNPNLVGGDVTAGISSLRQTLWRPARGGYVTPVSGLYLCSASTPPGGGVHGMCGFHAARALDRIEGGRGRSTG